MNMRFFVVSAICRKELRWGSSLLTAQGMLQAGLLLSVGAALGLSAATSALGEYVPSIFLRALVSYGSFSKELTGQLEK